MLGAGGWGTAVAVVLAESTPARVSLWCRSAPRCEQIRHDRENRNLLPGVAIPDHVEITDSASEAVSGAELLVIGVPLVHLRETLSRLRLRVDVPILSLCKGVERGTGKRATEILAELCGSTDLGTLSGPSHAEEVAQGKPTSVVVAAELSLARRVQAMLTSDRFRVYTSDDVIGVELGGALKNVIGLAAGICDGLGFGDNAKSALLTRGLAEIARYGVARGADRITFDGLAGMGDLVTTCFSPHGRNRRVGERLGQGETLDQILSDFAGVAEGVETCRAVVPEARKLGVEMPITEAVHAVLFEGLAPLEAVTGLMMRPPRDEPDAGSPAPTGQVSRQRV